MSVRFPLGKITSVSVGETVTLILAANEARRAFAIYHESSGKKVYWGYDNAITAVTGGGIPLVADALHGHDDYYGPVYGITPSGTGSVTVGAAEVLS